MRNHVVDISLLLKDLNLLLSATSKMDICVFKEEYIYTFGLYI